MTNRSKRVLSEMRISPTNFAKAIHLPKSWGKDSNLSRRPDRPPAAAVTDQADVPLSPSAHRGPVGCLWVSVAAILSGYQWWILKLSSGRLRRLNSFINKVCLPCEKKCWKEKKHEEVVKLMMKSSASMEDIKAQVEKSTELSEQSNQMAAEQRKSNEELQQTLKQQQSELASRSLKDAEESKRREEELMKRVEEANRRAEEANRRAEEAARKAKEAEEKHEEAKQNELAAKQLLESQKAKSAEEVAALEKKQSEHLEALQKQKADAEQKGAAESAKVAEKLSAEIESLKNTQKSELSALKSENRRKTRKRRNDAREAAAKAMRAYHENLKKHLDQQAESLNCSICYETFRDPRSLNCMHSFCRVCIEGWFRKQRTCPNCRQKCHRKDLHKNQVVFDSIEQFEKQSAELE
eukprot:808101_1